MVLGETLTIPGIQGDLLWENASPTSSFGEQTISLDLSKYTLVMIIARHWTDNARLSAFVMPIDGDYYLMTCPNDGFVTGVTRTARPNINSVYFRVGYDKNTATGQAAIPVRIIGIR